MKNLTLDRLAGLVRTASVHRVFLTPYPAIDGGGWFLDVDHSDNGQTRQLHTKRGGVRVIYFTTLADGTVSLLIVYPKSKTENLSPTFLRELRRLFLE